MPGTDWFAWICGVETLWPHAVQAANPVSFTWSCKKSEPLLGDLPGVAHVMLGWDLLQWDDNKGEGALLIGQCVVEDVVRRLSLLPMFFCPDPVVPHRLTHVPSSGGEVEETVNPTLFLPVLSNKC